MEAGADLYWFSQPGNPSRKQHRVEKGRVGTVIQKLKIWGAIVEGNGNRYGCKDWSVGVAACVAATKNISVVT